MFIDSEYDKWAIKNKIYDPAAFLVSMRNIKDPEFKAVRAKVLKMKDTLEPFVADTSSVQNFEDSLLKYCAGQFFVELAMIYNCVYKLRGETPKVEYLQDASADLLRIYKEDKEVFDKAFHILNKEKKLYKWSGGLKNRDQELMYKEFCAKKEMGALDQLEIPEVPEIPEIGDDTWDIVRWNTHIWVLL